MKRSIFCLSAVALLTISCVKLPLNDPTVPGMIIVKCESCKVTLNTGKDTISADLGTVGNSVKFKYDGPTKLSIAIAPNSDQVIGLRIFNRVNLQEFITRDTLVRRGDTVKYNYTIK